MEAKMDLARSFPVELYRDAKAKTTQICMRCGEPVRDLENPSSRLEYRISALCEVCREQIIYRCLNRAQEPD